MQEHMKIRSEYGERRMKCMHRSQQEEEEGREEKKPCREVGSRTGGFFPFHFRIQSFI